MTSLFLEFIESDIISLLIQMIVESFSRFDETLCSNIINCLRVRLTNCIANQGKSINFVVLMFGMFILVKSRINNTKTMLFFNLTIIFIRFDGYFCPTCTFQKFFLSKNAFFNFRLFIYYFIFS